MKDDWRVIDCYRCDGKRVIATWDVPDECPVCCGNGVIWVRPTDHVFKWPGGPALGKWPGAYQMAMSFGQYDEAETAFGTIRAGVSPKW